MKEITPVIKKIRTVEVEYEECPHCHREIGEKESYIDEDYFVYHRPCMEKGPIDKIKPKQMFWSEEKRCWDFKDCPMKAEAGFSLRWNGSGFDRIPAKTAQVGSVQEIRGKLNRHIAGHDFTFDYVAHVGDESLESVSVSKPKDMEQYLWNMNREILEKEAMQEAYRTWRAEEKKP